MTKQTYAIGVDYGTESGRALVVDVATGRELGSAVHAYANSVLDERLPADAGGAILEPDWALQDPNDYLEVLKHAVPAAIKASGISPNDVVGIGIDFTACTMLPTRADGTPLCFLPEFRHKPHSWVKLWKHHAAQPEADHVNAVARAMGEPWLDRYGGKISSEWFFPKVLQILTEAPEIYHAADRFIEACDWVIWQLTGAETRNSCTAGYKAMWQKETGYPRREYLAALNPDFANVVSDKMACPVSPLGSRAGGLSHAAAVWTGLPAGIAVAVANVDAHVTVPSAQATDPGTMVMIMGTSICHMVIGEHLHVVPGMCGVVEDGITPGTFGYEAGQSAVGDIFGWFIEHGVPATVSDEARAAGVSVHTLLEQRAARLKPGESGLIALDWHNGNRSTLVDVELGGLMLGSTLLTKPHEQYRALIEATAFGTREIIEALERHGVPVHRLVAAGGLPERNKLLMQIYADVTQRSIGVVRAEQAPAQGAALHGAVAAGAYANILDAARAMGGLKDEAFVPNAANKAIYDELFTEYKKLYDYFGRGANNVMKTLKRMKREARSA